MPSYTETIDWKPDAMTAGVSLANTNDLVKCDELTIERLNQNVQNVRAATSSPLNRRNQAGTRTFTVTKAPYATAIAARTAMEALEDSLAAFSTTAPILEWVFGDKKHTFSNAVLGPARFELMGTTLKVTYTFSYGAKSTAAYP